jgi:hypothetical protein
VTPVDPAPTTFQPQPAPPSPGRLADSRKVPSHPPGPRELPPEATREVIWLEGLPSGHFGGQNSRCRPSERLSISALSFAHTRSPTVHGSHQCASPLRLSSRACVSEMSRESPLRCPRADDGPHRETGYHKVIRVLRCAECCKARPIRFTTIPTSSCIRTLPRARPSTSRCSPRRWRHLAALCAQRQPPPQPAPLSPPPAHHVPMALVNSTT